MNEMEMVAVHKCFVIYPIKKFENKIDNNIISVETRHDTMLMHIKSRKGRKKLSSFGFRIMEILFLYLGAFPKLQSVTLNGDEQDIEEYVDKFMTYQYFVRNDLQICKINEESLNDTVFQNYQRLNHLPIYSMEYIFSEAYKKVNITHKITLLTHVIEGVTSQKYYKERVEDIFKEFFRLHRKYGCGILNLLNKNKKAFVNVFVDTRHWYSHFLKESERTDRMTSGTEMVIYFEILYYSIRLFLISKLGSTVCEDTVQEYLYSIHDWILEIKYGKDEPLKSKVYQSSKKWKEVQHEIEELSKRAAEEIEGYSI